MKDELYIDNKAVDIDDNTNITLNYKSNIFTEVSKIVSNNTYSIKLPMTVRNCNVIDHAHLPTCSTRFPRINHKGRYLRNGVEIVSNASVTLMEVSDTIDIAMAWGNVSAFAEIVNGDKTLQDLSYGMVENEDYIVWSKDLGNSPRLPWLSYGYKRDEPNAWFHPAVSAKWVLDKISKDSGVKFVIPESRQNFVERLVIPLLTRNIPQKWIDDRTMSLIPQDIIDYSLPGYVFTIMRFDITGVDYYAAPITQFDKVIAIKPKMDTPFRLLGTIKMLVKTNKEPTNVGEYAVSLDLRNKDNMVSVVKLRCVPDISFIEENSYRYTFNFDVEMNPGVAEDLSFVLYDPYASRENHFIEKGSELKILMPDTVGLYRVDKYRACYYYVPNLPDIKQIDFIKAISALCGMFAIPDAGDIRFITMDEIVANKSKALNWTKRVVASYPQNRPKMLSFSLDNFAQKNIYKWKDDEEGENDGIIYVDDKTLNEEGEVITLPFAASEIKDSRTGPYTEIPLYSYNENGELEYNDNLTPRLLIMENQVIATFEGLDWKSIIAAQYKVYQEEVREPKVITELIEIPDYELKKLDMSVPIYLGQYGKFYAVISIKAEKTGICECKLFQL